MKNFQIQDTNFYLAHGDFNISQFHLRQSLTLERHGTTIEFGILQNNHFLRIKRGSEIISEVCTSLSPILNTEKIVHTQELSQPQVKFADTVTFGQYAFEALLMGEAEGEAKTKSLKRTTNDEHVYKLTHVFPAHTSTEGDRLELYLDVSDSILLKTIRMNPREQKALFTSSELRLH